jgi:hypothetical protein
MNSTIEFYDMFLSLTRYGQNRLFENDIGDVIEKKVWNGRKWITVFVYKN